MRQQRPELLGFPDEIRKFLNLQNIGRDFARIERFIETAKAAERLKLCFAEVPADDELWKFSSFVKIETMTMSKHLEVIRGRIVDEFLDARTLLSLQISQTDLRN